MQEHAGEDWYDREESTRAAMITELQRIRRRFLAHPLRVLALAAVTSTALTYKVATRAAPLEAEVVLALTEGAMSADKHHGLPVDDLRQWVDGVLITDVRLAQLIERHDLYPSRRTLGMPYAIEQLRGQVDIQIWRNSFVYYDEDAARAEHSARIGITVTDTDPDRAFAIVRDLAAIVIDTAQQQRLQLNTQLSRAVEVRRDGLARRLRTLTRAASENHAALARARRGVDAGVAHALELELAEIGYEEKAAERRLAEIATSRDAMADRIAAAGLDTRIGIVEEGRPDRPEHRDLVVAMAAVVIAIGSVIGSALLLGAFDSRIHDAEDVGRLGIPMLGHLPAFAGDREGSLRTRGVPRSLISHGARWRFPR
jgi:hypothetical protein